MKTLAILIIALLLSCTLFAKEEETTLHTPTGDIYGTLLTPDNNSTVPVAILIAGSGPTDRNCNNHMGLNTDAFKMLAESLNENGIASLRYDKRGIAASAASMKSEADLRFDDLINDVKSWAELLSKDKRFSKIILIGHSEGSLIGMLAAIDNPKIDGYVSVAGAGESIGLTLRRQLKPQPDPIREEAERILKSLEKGDTVADVHPFVQALFRPSVQPYMISWLKYDPAKDIAKLNIPTLIVLGTTDIQVEIRDAELLAAGNPKARKVIIENMNHTLKDCNTMDRNIQMATYSNPDFPLNKEFENILIEFINQFK